MQHTITLITGIAASVLCAISMLPQLIKIAKEKAAENISIPMLILLIVGLSLWVTYGIFIKDFIIIISNSVSVLINITVLVLAVKYKGQAGNN